MSKREELVFSVSILDIDWFKKVNDTYGHLAGDYVLKELTRIMKENIRSYDLFGRYGGEEFIIVTTGREKQDVNTYLKRILKIVSETVFSFQDNYIQITINCGIADTKDLGKKDLSIENLISIADKRLYHAKATGRNKIVCEIK